MYEALWNRANRDAGLSSLVCLRRCFELQAPFCLGNRKWIRRNVSFDDLLFGQCAIRWSLQLFAELLLRHAVNVRRGFREVGGVAEAGRVACSLKQHCTQNTDTIVVDETAGGDDGGHGDALLLARTRFSVLAMTLRSSSGVNLSALVRMS
jgi:hypothetical protein